MSTYKTTSRIYGWHFTTGDKLRDGSPAAAPGRVEKFRGTIKLCESGLHFSQSLLDAMLYAPGGVVYLRLVVAPIGARVVYDRDKITSDARGPMADRRAEVRPVCHA